MCILIWIKLRSAVSPSFPYAYRTTPFCQSICLWQLWCLDPPLAVLSGSG